MINKLEKIEFHDSGLNSLNIDFENNIINLVVEYEMFNTQKFIIKSLIFNKVSSLFFNMNEKINEFYSLEIIEATFKKNNTEYCAKFIIIADFNKVMILKFSFQEVEIYNMNG